VVVMGCPSDEIHAPGSIARGGGKALSAEAGLWDDVDAALYAHPEFIDTVSLESRWMQRAIATVSGSRSLATADQPPLEAALAALESARAYVPDDLMLERLELDGDVEEGTGLVLQATFLVFADAEGDIEQRLAALRAVVPQARWELGRVVEAVRPNDLLTAAVARAFDVLDRDFVSDPPRLPFATDFGNISRRCPAALIGVGREGGWAFHTDEGAAQFASPEGEAAALTIAQVLSLAAADLTEPR
jgi:metal-dependent amidase/aminoacylase/carboxypeptidase family protein